MYDIPMGMVTEDFVHCWNMAGMHLQIQAGEPLRWLKAHPHPPFLEHLSFLLGIQFFFIQVEDVDHHLEIPGALGGLLSIANGCEGHACVMPMRKTLGEWAPVEKGWGLLDARSRRPINPPDLISDDQIEMTAWELQDFAVQIVREKIEKDGHTLISWQSNPNVDPSIWFNGTDGHEWVVVRAVKYPGKTATQPENLQGIRESCELYSRGSIGNFASVLFTSLQDPFDALAEQNGNIAPLYRGDGIDVQYDGLQRLTFS